MRIEPYSESYLDDLVKIVKNFYNESLCEYESFFDPTRLLEVIKREGKESSNNAFLLIVDGKCEGLIYGTKFTSPVSGKEVYQEMIWYVNEPHRGQGIKFLREVEKLLKYNGVSIMIMAVMENSKTEKLKKFYESLGFKHMETHFVRSLDGLG